jgi:hypothetical protein
MDALAEQVTELKTRLPRHLDSPQHQLRDVRHTLICCGPTPGHGLTRCSEARNRTTSAFTESNATAMTSTRPTLTAVMPE